MVHRYPHHPDDPQSQSSEEVGEEVVMQALLAQLQDNNEVIGYVILCGKNGNNMYNVSIQLMYYSQHLATGN